MTATRPIHAQQVPGEPQAARWVVATGDLAVGEVRRAPGTLGPLLEYGVISRMLIEADGVWTWLAPGQTWLEHGPRIRGAITAALDLDGWEIEPGSADLLGLIARDVVEGELAAYIASHGGTIRVIDNDAESVLLDFGGACDGCPASGQTLHQRIETAIRARYPRLRSVTREGDGGRGLPLLPMPGRSC
ncbi:MAG: NifU family protein [Propionibacteriaceae bacterium]|nr:NifU family protein [Propionibacteriaceae bacterium]